LAGRKESAAMRIRLKLAYDDPARNDGNRVLVDRVWPRGVSKEDAELDEWMKEIAPTGELRKWFGHDPDEWDEFKKRYFDELDDREEPVKKLLAMAGEKTLTLVYGAKDEEHNNAVALKEYLEEKAD
jgi:uncharacterized protein YeaO (DUF488 family)